MGAHFIGQENGRGRQVLQWVPDEEDRTWVVRGLCVNKPDLLDFFFDEKTAQQAKKYCIPCPVKAECLEEALSMPRSQDQGVRGGKSQKQRQQIRWNRARDRRLTIVP